MIVTYENHTGHLSIEVVPPRAAVGDVRGSVRACDAR